MNTFFRDLTYTYFIKLVEKNDFIEIVQQDHKQILREEVNSKTLQITLTEDFYRYQNRVCFDYSRVILPVEKRYGNYINANYVNGYEYDKKYICTQAPLKHTCYDFWRMGWMNDTQIIVMLCQKIEDKKEKCYAYWRDTEGSAVEFNKFTITTTKIEYYASYVKTTLLMTDGTSASQEITHFGFTQWPDFGTPTDTEDFLNFMLAVRQNQEEVIKQLIHCGQT
ncbi:hypothetical protein PR048_001613 [Dryococelus australis]|uniref:protein-tyrosine-phosphatase n=1 Tax=Dryococelus australis TaxID=614101 RepID=A0ABQ9IHS3_9NEOP|nr:hypothetical protein PR048_001613 [Dryococelus australis]